MTELLVAAFVYLAAAVVAAPIAKRIGLGSVLGYLIAGVLIGPAALNLVGDPTDVMHMAEFGVVILLFLIGLEVQPSLLWRLRGTIFGLGAAQVIGSAALLGGAAYLAGLTWPMALAIGLFLSLSSTAIVLQMLEENGLRHGAVGQGGFGVLLFQDLAVIPILALLPLLATLPVAHGAGDSHAAPTLVAALPGWGKALVALLAVGAVVGFGRYLIRPIFRYIADAGLREAFTAFALLIVVGVAVLMQQVGLSPALGAFVAGVVLAESEFRRELETDIEPFRGLLLGLFFLTVGASLNLGLVLADPLQIGAMVLGLLVLKGALIFGVARLSGLYWRDAGTLAAALCGGGEFAFVLFSAASTGGILPPDLASRLTATVALSMAATPLVFLAWQALSRAPAEAELTPENEAFAHSDPDAIIAGHGRFGQMVSRLLEVNGLKVATLESSVAQIALLRKFGRRVYYGDAGRLDLLRAAGAEKAKILVVAIDDSEKAVEIVRMAREAFPQLMILARAYDRRHYYELMQAGAHRIEREVFEGGLAMGAEALKALGWRAYTAERAARLFRRHDERMLESLADLWQDVERYSVAARESAPAMEDVMRADLHQMSGRAQDTWAHDKQTMSDGKEKEASTAV